MLIYKRADLRFEQTFLPMSTPPSLTLSPKLLLTSGAVPLGVLETYQGTWSWPVTLRWTDGLWAGLGSSELCLSIDHLWSCSAQWQCLAVTSTTVELFARPRNSTTSSLGKVCPSRCRPLYPSMVDTHQTSDQISLKFFPYFPPVLPVSSSHGKETSSLSAAGSHLTQLHPPLFLFFSALLSGCHDPRQNPALSPFPSFLMG